jgi:hypothetical protein
MISKTHIVCLVALLGLNILVNSTPAIPHEEIIMEDNAGNHESRSNLIDSLIGGYMQKITELFQLRTEINSKLETLEDKNKELLPQLNDLKDSFGELEMLIDDLLVNSQQELNEIIDHIQERDMIFMRANDENGGLNSMEKRQGIYNF